MQGAGENTRMVTHRLTVSQVADTRCRMAGHQIAVCEHSCGLVHTVLVVHQLVHANEVQRSLVDDQGIDILMDVIVLSLEVGGCRVAYRVRIFARIGLCASSGWSR